MDNYFERREAGIVHRLTMGTQSDLIRLTRNPGYRTLNQFLSRTQSGERSLQK
jgi:hypothetical protein